MKNPRYYKVAVVNSHPIQYFAPLYAYLSQDPDIQITALYCSDFSLRGCVDPGFKEKVSWNIDLLSGYSCIFLGKRAKLRIPGGFFSLVCPEIWREVRHGGYDVVWLHGYAYAAYVLAFLAAKSRGIPVFIRSETHLRLARSGMRRRIRDAILSVAYRFVDGFLAIGSANAEYYRSLGVDDKKIHFVPYSVDNSRFIKAATLTAADRQELRANYGIHPDSKVVLYASKFMKRKHPDDVVSAVNILNKQGIQVALLFVGTGEMEAQLREQAIALGLEQVVFAGFVNQRELPQLYAASDVFVLPSENEPWGLAINEAMCAGLPIVAADEVGCVPDLVKNGVNGAHMRAGDIGSLVEALRMVLFSGVKEMGEESLSIIQKWSYEECRRGLKNALIKEVN